MCLNVITSNSPKTVSILILNGPNLNLQGIRQPEVYGTNKWQDLDKLLLDRFPNIIIDRFQSNHEGILLDKIQSAITDYQGIIVNLGALSHYSYALADGIRSILPIPVIEVHLSNIYAREESFRHHSVIAPACVGSICGFGLYGYVLAVETILRLLKKEK